MSWVLNLVAGLACGVLSGCGVGGGSLLLLWLMGIGALSLPEAQSVNLLYFLPTAGAALLLHQKHGLLRWRIVLPAVIAGSILAIPAVLLAGYVQSELLQKLFAVFLLCIGVKEVFAGLRSERSGHSMESDAKATKKATDGAP